MNGEMGLAQQLSQQTEPMRDLDQIVAMLKQGVSPDELVQQGIPAQLVAEAMRVIQQEMTQIPPEQAGMAGMVLQGGM